VGLEDLLQRLHIVRVWAGVAGEDNDDLEAPVLAGPDVVEDVLHEHGGRERGQPRLPLADDRFAPDRVTAQLVDVPEHGGRDDPAMELGRAPAECVGAKTIAP